MLIQVCTNVQARKSLAARIHKVWTYMIMPCKNLLVLKLAPSSHSAFTQYSCHFQALIFQNLCNSKKVEHFSGMFAACQHAYLSPLKLNLCSNGMDHGTRHIQSCLLLHSPTNASMHDRCIRRYLKFRGLCLSPCFLD